MARIIQKFGGTSIATVDCLHRAAQIVVDTAAEHEVVTVVSAMGDTTNQLLSLAKQLMPEPNMRELDMLLTTGEQQAAALMSLAIQDLNKGARSFTGAQAGIITEPSHGQARIKEIYPQAIEACLSEGKIAVVAGFQGISESKELTTLGRGGSDITAVALANALKAQYCDIYTDVNGVYTADPAVLSEAKKLSTISYEELLEMCLGGAKVVHPAAVELAMKAHMPVRVRSTFAPDDTGTLITHNQATLAYPVCGISFDFDQDTARISVITHHFNRQPTLTTQISDTLSKASISIHKIFADDMKIIVLIPKTHVQSAVKLLHQSLGLANEISVQPVATTDTSVLEKELVFSQPQTALAQ